MARISIPLQSLQEYIIISLLVAYINNSTYLKKILDINYKPPLQPLTLVASSTLADGWKTPSEICDDARQNMEERRK